jgi:CobQ-like glutamine amidotransferase family enzyme
LVELAEKGTPMLVVCGMFQLFGHFFETLTGEVIDGTGILDMKTLGKTKRIIGNIVTESEYFGKIVGYENHSGQTFLGDKVSPLAKVVKGVGNNENENFEGARYKNVIGTYLHGSLLPKNPKIADFLIINALHKKFGYSENGEQADKIKEIDSLAEVAREFAEKRPR